MEWLSAATDGGVDICGGRDALYFVLSQGEEDVNASLVFQKCMFLLFGDFVLSTEFKGIGTRSAGMNFPQTEPLLSLSYSFMETNKVTKRLCDLVVNNTQRQVFD